MISMKRLSFLVFITLGLFIGCSDETDFKSDEEKQLNLLESRSVDSDVESNSVVPIEIAQEIAVKYSLLKQERFSDGNVNIVGREVLNYHTLPDKMGVPALYVITYKNDLGYLVISADWRHEPICAVTKRGTYPDIEAPSMLIEWFEATIENIEFIRYKELDNVSRGIMEWNRLIEEFDLQARIIPFGSDCCEECPNWPDCQYDAVGCGDETVHCDDEDPCGSYTTTIVGPLMSTEWGQRCTYNEQVEDKNCSGVCWSNTRAFTGCVATAMSQIVRYWEVSTSHSYNYSTMPDGSGNSEVQRLMKDTGESVDMDYGCDASGAKSSKVPGALKNDFDFSSATRNSYGSGSYQTVVSNIASNKPVYLDGCRSKKTFLGITYKYTNCHAWVCDGYWRTRNNCYSYLKLYMNWGWNGSHNGWFAFNNWTIPANGRNYQYARDYIHNIQP